MSNRMIAMTLPGRTLSNGIHEWYLTAFDRSLLITTFYFGVRSVIGAGSAAVELQYAQRGGS